MKESASIDREALLSIVRTSSILLKVAGRFFSKFAITDVQFNILIILKEAPAEGLSQQELSKRLVVTKSNVVGLIDRLEKSGLVERKANPNDRRFNCIVLTQEGRKMVEKVEADYLAEVSRIMAPLDKAEKKAIIGATMKIRDYLDQWEDGKNE